MYVYVVHVASLATNSIVFLNVRYLTDLDIYSTLCNSAKHAQTITFIYIHSWTNSEKIS